MRIQNFSFLLILICGLFTFGTSPQQAAFAQPAAVAAPPVDSGWPRTHQKDGETVVIYQPQVDEWKDHEKIEFRAATAVTPRGATEPILGVISGRADTVVDHETRTVYFTNIQLDTHFDGQEEAKAQSLQKVVQDVMSSKGPVPISLERVLACMKKPQASAGVQVNLDPPQMDYSDSPAILVMFHGAPEFKPAPNTRLQFAVNTNWDLFQDPLSSTCYLLNVDSWLTAPDPVKGPWAAAGTLPPDLSKLPADANWDDVRKNIPGKQAASAPKVIVSAQPAELIVTNGKPELVEIPGTTLKYVTNPEMPLIFNTADSNYYYLVAGRWFRTRNLFGGWEAASAQLPDVFQQIPPDNAIGYVLASVPGTEQAKDAILLAAIPHKATIKLSEAKVAVAYDGAPKFVPIQGTTMTYAVNTSNQVILAGGQYYCCYQGVWFAGPAATGPWRVCTSVPQIIYTIPPTCPLYNCTYVPVYSATPTTVVVGYTAGYSGEYVAATGAVMFGAGMIAGAIIANNSDHYYGYPAPFYSYGCAAHYNYAYGGFYASAAHYGPYGGAAYSARYNPATGTYSRGAAAYGAYGGSASIHQAYNPYTHTAASHATASNGYDSWGSSAVEHNGHYAAAGHETYANGASRGGVETSSGKGGNAYQTAGGATVAKSNSGDVYAGKDGNVYKKSDSGDWQKHSSSGWENADKERSSQMNSEFQSRSRGNAETSRSESFGSEGRFSSFGGGGRSFGGSGGGGRSFGGFRGGRR